jgi:hypothetical protein
MEQNVDTGAPMTPVADNKQRSGKGLKTATAIACIVAVCGIGFGVHGMMQSLQKDSQISDLKIQLDSRVDDPTIANQNEEGNDSNGGNMFIINQMGIGIKNLDNAGTISQYKYVMDRSALAGDHPISSIEILSFSGVPEVGTDYITGISGAIIYEYDEGSFFDTSKCTVQIGKINEHNFCVARRSIDEEYRQLSDEVFAAWNTWAESNIDRLMTVLSDPENYVNI